MHKVVAIPNLALAVAWAVNLYYQLGNSRAPWWADPLGIAILVLFLANTWLLWKAKSAPGKGRISRMVGYWFDAKEAELKAKAGAKEEVNL